MKQPTVKKQIEIFNNQYINDLQEARKIILSYRKLCYLSGRVCEMQNDSEYINSSFLADQEAREEKHRERLQNYLNPYNLILEYPGIYPIICTKGTDGRPANHAYMF